MNMELFTAVLAGDRPSITTLLAGGADPNARKTACWRAVIEMVSKHPQFAPYLLGRDYTEANPLIIWTWTPVLLACAHSRWDIAGDLLDAGAQADASDEQAHTPLLFAIRGAQPGLVKRLLAGGANPNATIKDGVNPLMTAAALGSSGLTYPCVGPRRAAPTEGPTPPETLARYAEILVTLLEYGAEVNTSAQKGETALTLAAGKGWIEGVHLLLDAGAHLTCEGPFTGTPLMACLPIYPEIARLLIERGADVNAHDRWGGTVLTHAIGYRPGEYICSSKRTSASSSDDKPDSKLPDLRDFTKQTHEPLAPEDLTALTLLLDAGADPNLACHNEFGTPLITSALRDAPLSIRLLVARGADLNGRDARGRTPLIVAAWQGCPRAVQALLECGADYTLRSDSGDTALMAASIPGRCGRMLRKLDSMPPVRPVPEYEESLQRLQELKEKLGEHAAEVPDIDQMRRLGEDFRQRMRGNLEHEIGKQSSNREKVVKILKGAGATE